MAVRVNRRYLTGYRRGAQVAAIDPFGFAQGRLPIAMGAL